MKFLPPINSKRYYVLLALIAMFILGPLGAIVGAFMLFAIGFSVGGQVLAGILGSVVTYRYGPEGRHAGNYMQTAAASVASVGSLAVLLQARAWLGLPDLPSWLLMVYVCSIGMFGVGLGMLYTPIVVDRMKLKFPSGLAVANILRALTDPKLLKQSIAKLGTGTGIGFLLGVGSSKLPSLGALGLSLSTIGAGMIVGARIAIPGLVVAVVGAELLPYFVSIGWLEEGQPFRKIGFVICLGMILGAAALDIALILYGVVKKAIKNRGQTKEAPAADWKKRNILWVLAWVFFWGGLLFLLGVFMLDLPVTSLLLAMGLVLVFLLVNGISMGISDSNPVSAAFVIGVFLMGSIGLRDINAGLMCAAVLLVACSVGVDMQQSRSTGSRLGTNRMGQFAYQVIGVLTGAVLCVILAKLFLNAYPILQVNQYGLTEPLQGAEKWSSAFTFKLVGVLKDMASPNKNFTVALEIGIGIGLVTEILRKMLKVFKPYQRFLKSGKTGFAVGFTMDCFILPSPYASSFGGFVELTTAVWFAIGGILTSFAQTLQNEMKPKPQPVQEDEPVSAESMSEIVQSSVRDEWPEKFLPRFLFCLKWFASATMRTTIQTSKATFSFRWFMPTMRAILRFIKNVPKHFGMPARDETAEDEAAGQEEMSTISLVGGGLIAGDALGALVLGIIALIAAIL